MEAKIADLKTLMAYDKENMYEVLKAFPEQIKKACEIGRKAPLFRRYNNPANIMVLGMGGSAIGGDLLRSYSAVTPGAKHLNFTINRTYDLPGFTNNDYYIIASSYSGNTEETLSGFEQALKLSKNLICITTGGKLKKLAAENNIPVVGIPGGLQPRCALGYSFFPMLFLMIRSGAYEENARKESEAAIEELIPKLESKIGLYSNFTADNPAIALALAMRGKIPVIYSSSEGFDTVNIRWRGQIQENAKHAAFGALLPEMNHNEINAWSYPDCFRNSGLPVFLQDPGDNPRVKLRFEALGKILEEKGYGVISLSGEGDYLLTRIFDLLYLIDWAAYYLALFNNVDPTAIPLIDKLKNFLADK